MFSLTRIIGIDSVAKRSATLGKAPIDLRVGPTLSSRYLGVRVARGFKISTALVAAWKNPSDEAFR